MRLIDFSKLSKDVSFGIAAGRRVAARGPRVPTQVTGIAVGNLAAIS